MKLYDNFTQQYSLSKTLRFELDPQGETRENMNKHLQYDEDLQTFFKDQEIEDAYQTLKPVLDGLHEEFINISLESNIAKEISFEDYLIKYRDKKVTEALEKKLRAKIGETYSHGALALIEKAKNFNVKKDADFFKKENEEILTKNGIFIYLKFWIEDSNIYHGSDREKILEALTKFTGFTTYFGGYHKNRENYYHINEEKATAVATRIIHENLPKFCNNIIQFEKNENYLNAYKFLQEKNITIQDKNGGKLNPINADIFKISYFNSCLSQNGIEEYNKLIGEAKHVINLYNQQHKDKKDRLECFKTLFKQIGCGKRDALFFSIKYDFANQKNEEERKNENEVLSVEEILKLAKMAGEQSFSGNTNDDKLTTINDFVKWLKSRDDWQGIYWSDKTISAISNKYFVNWYEIIKIIQANAKDYKNVASYDKKREEAVKMNKAVELSGLFKLLDEAFVGVKWWEIAFKKSLWDSENSDNQLELIKNAGAPSKAIIALLIEDVIQQANSFIKESAEIIKLKEYKSDDVTKKDVKGNDKYIDGSKSKIKNWLDSGLSVMRFVKSFRVRESHAKGAPINVELDDFINEFTSIEMFKWNDAVRNYLVKKPQDDAKENKLKLNFENSTLATGWDVNKEVDNSCVILFTPENNVYLAISKKGKHPFVKEIIGGKEKNQIIKTNPLYDTNNADVAWRKMEYDFWADVSKMIPHCSTQLNVVKKHFESNANDYLIKKGHEVTSGEKFVEDCIITKEQYELNNLVYMYDDNKKQIVSAMRSELSKSEEKNYFKAFQKKYLEILIKASGGDSITEADKNIAINTYYKFLHAWIDFCKYFLSKYPKTILFNDNYKTRLKNTSEYTSINDFYHDIDISSYKLETKLKINKSVLDELVKNGDIYLFKMISKDSKDKSTGKQNLQTIYWNSVFSNFSNRPKLSGKAEIFYRKPVNEIKNNQIIHLKNIKIARKKYKDENTGIIKSVPNNIVQELNKHFQGRISLENLTNEAKKYINNYSILNHDIIKNKRFVSEKFIFHCSVAPNFCLNNTNINETVNSIYPDDPQPLFLGLDRGEKHLVYYALVDTQGLMIEQGSFNEINGFNYLDKLVEVEGNRQEARKNWQAIGNIKSLKEGYISQVVHEIVKKILQQKTYIVLEDLNTGFKRGRQKIERQIYQKFELALAKKLNFIVQKDVKDGEIGSVTNAIQLTPPVANYSDIEDRKQVGIMLYTRANYTSQTDPVTGWRKTIYLKPGSEENIKEQIFASFTKIGFDGKDYYFIYTHPKSGKEWTLWSSKDGEGLLRFRGKRGAEKYQWISEKYNPKEMLDGLFIKLKNKGTWDFDLDRFHEIELTKTDDKHTAWESFRFVIELIQQIRNSSGAGDINDNFLLSPVRDCQGLHYDSRSTANGLPKDADANGAFNIARKGIIMNAHIKQWIKDGKKEYKKGKDLDLFISEEEWDLWLTNLEEWQKQLPIFASRKAMEDKRDHDSKARNEQSRKKAKVKK